MIGLEHPPLEAIALLNNPSTEPVAIFADMRGRNSSVPMIANIFQELPVAFLPPLDADPTFSALPTLSRRRPTGFGSDIVLIPTVVGRLDVFCPDEDPVTDRSQQLPFEFLVGAVRRDRDVLQFVARSTLLEVLDGFAEPVVEALVAERAGVRPNKLDQGIDRFDHANQRCAAFPHQSFDVTEVQVQIGARDEIVQSEIQHAGDSQGLPESRLPLAGLDSRDCRRVEAYPGLVSQSFKQLLLRQTCTEPRRLRPLGESSRDLVI
nr:hypothetical protein [Mycobacterium cookii]